MNRRAVKYELIAGNVLDVKREVKRMVEQDGWSLLGGLVRLNDSQVCRELVKYEPLTAVTSSGHVVKEH